MNVLNDPRAWVLTGCTTDVREVIAGWPCGPKWSWVFHMDEDKRLALAPGCARPRSTGGGLAVRAPDGCPVDACVLRAVAEPPDPRPFLRRWDFAQAPAAAFVVKGHRLVLDP